MSRTDEATRVVEADAQRVFAALLDEAALAQWLPPNGMTGRFEHFDARPGGSYRLVLSYPEESAGSGKTTAGSDVVEVRFVEVVPDVRVVQAVDFVSDDPAFSGTMTMTWEVSAEDDDTRVTIRADDVPSGINAEDHEVGLSASLAQLEKFLLK
jgi:uncharacterized protein YndB with AHSA1/START domain